MAPMCSSTRYIGTVSDVVSVDRDCTAEECFEIDLEGGIHVQNWNTKSSLVRDILSLPLSIPSPFLKPPEPRVAMILNRYTLSLAILYLSSRAVLDLDPDTAVGTSFLSYIVPSQRSRVEMQIWHIKTFPSLIRMRFAWMVPRLQTNGPCEVHAHPLQPVALPADPGQEVKLCPTPHATNGVHSAAAIAFAAQAPPRCPLRASVHTVVSSSITASDREALLAGGLGVVECEAQLWGSADGIVCVIRELAAAAVVSTKRTAITL